MITARDHLTALLAEVAPCINADIVTHLENAGKADRPTAVTIISPNNNACGQLILSVDENERGLVAERLRLCADILDGIAPAEAYTIAPRVRKGP